MRLVTLFVHVGLPKTGSTTIQGALRQASRRALNGKDYVGTFCCVGQTGFRRPPPPIARRVRRRVARGSELIMSSENLLGKMNSGFDSAAFKAQGLLDFFGTETDIRLILYLRPQVSWAESLYIQFVKMGATGTSEQVLSSILNSRTLKYTALVSDLISVVGAQNLVVRAYPPRRSLLSDFDQICGTALASQTRATEQRNVSLSSTQTFLLERINQRGSGSISRNARFLLESEHPPLFKRDPYSVLPETLQGELNSVEQEDWPNLARLVGSTYQPDQDAFEEVVRMTESWRPRQHIDEASAVGPYGPDATSALVEALQRADRSLRLQRLQRNLRRYRPSKLRHARRSLACRVANLLQPGAGRS